MPEVPYSLKFINELIDRTDAALACEEQTGVDGGPLMQLHTADDASISAGYVRLWTVPNSPVDRIIHMRLQAPQVETQLLFMFGRPETSMPHIHAQVVQFPPEGYVYNVDLIPRLDPVDHPDWFERVFTALRRPYKKAIGDPANSCAQAPQNPALAIYMSPWGIGSGATDRAELDRVAPAIHAYVDHWLNLAGTDGWDITDPAAQAARDARHMERFFADELDPRAWNGVYRMLGKAAGQQVKALMQTPYSSS